MVRFSASKLLKTPYKVIQGHVHILVYNSNWINAWQNIQTVCWFDTRHALFVTSLMMWHFLTGERRPVRLYRSGTDAEAELLHLRGNPALQVQVTNLPTSLSLTWLGRSRYLRWLRIKCGDAMLLR